MENNNFEWLCRTELLVGREGIERLSNARVAVFGIGGVGGYVCEALARSGIGNIDLFDGDVISLSNINRQIIALHSTVGRAKTDVMRERILDINPLCCVRSNNIFYTLENASLYSFNNYDYIIDAIDSVESKIELIVRAKSENVPVISSMGTGNRLDTKSFSITDISKTAGCPLAKVMRRELRLRSIFHLKVLASSDTPIKAENINKERHFIGSVAYVPSVAGLMIAGEVIRDLLVADNANKEEQALNNLI